jgi:hypothetical protein
MKMYAIAEYNYDTKREAEDDATTAHQEYLADEWFEAVTKKSIDTRIDFDYRDNRDVKLAGGVYLKRKSTVAEVFDDVRDYNDFSGRMIEVIVQAHKSGNLAATKLLTDMSNAYGYYTS